MSKLTVKGIDFIIRNLLDSLNKYSSIILNGLFSTKWNIEYLYTELINLNTFYYTSSLCVVHLFPSFTQIYTYEMKMVKVVAGDAGGYRCEVSAKDKCDSCTFEVTVEG